MITVRSAKLPLLGVLVALALTGCSLLPSAPATPETPVSEAPAAPAFTSADLEDTTWSGTDSAGTEISFLLNADGHTSVTYSGTPFDDAADTWTLTDSTLEISIKNIKDFGDATYTGEVVDPDSPVDLTVTFTQSDETRTVTITR